MSVIIVTEQDRNDLRVYHVYLQSQVSYSLSVTYKRWATHENRPANTYTVRVGPGERVKVGLNCSYPTYSRNCSTQVSTEIINYTQIRKSMDSVNKSMVSVEDENPLSEFGLDYAPPGAVRETNEEEAK